MDWLNCSLNACLCCTYLIVRWYVWSVSVFVPLVLCVSLHAWFVVNGLLCVIVCFSSLRCLRHWWETPHRPHWARSLRPLPAPHWSRDIMTLGMLQHAAICHSISLIQSTGLPLTPLGLRRCVKYMFQQNLAFVTNIWNLIFLLLCHFWWYNCRFLLCDALRTDTLQKYFSFVLLHYYIYYK